jgi:hypothetical protein
LEFPKDLAKAVEGLRPDFLSTFLALANSMRLSLMKAAHADAGGTPWQEIRVAQSFSAHVRFGEHGAPARFPSGFRDSVQSPSIPSWFL